METSTKTKFKARLPKQQVLLNGKVIWVGCWTKARLIMQTIAITMKGAEVKIRDLPADGWQDVSEPH